MIARWFMAGALALLPVVAQAQTANPSLTAHAGGVRSDEAVRKLNLQRLDTVVTVRGAVAETSVTAVFANPGNDILEGDFRFMLPEGAVVTGYALDVNGQMIAGVLVDQPKAKAVYEERVRQRVDPGLAEVTTDGAFKTRVFPIPPRGTRTIRLRFVAPLYAPAQSDDIYMLPLSVQPSEGWSITVRSSDATAPGVTWPGRATGPMVRDGEGWIARGEGKSELSGALAISRARLPEAILSRNALGERFVQISGASGPAGVGLAGRVRVYWDRSRSRLQGRHEDELALLRRTLTALNPRSIEIVLFNSSGAERKTVASVDAAIAALKAVQYRGASSFAALANETAPVDRCLLFSNGRPAIDRAAALSAKCRLDAITTAPDADMAWLRHVAASHGGRAFALGADGSAIEKALGAAEGGVTGVFDSAGKRLDFVPVESRAGRWMVIARAPANGGAVSVRTGSIEAKVALPDSAAAFEGEGQLLALDTLATLGASEQREAYVALSRRYSVASPSLSFLVLETPNDYVTADIAPPEGYPKELLAQYREQRKHADDGEARARASRLDEVAGMWAEQVNWWKRRFPTGRPRPPKPVTTPMPTPMPEAVPAPVQAPSPPSPPVPDRNVIMGNTSGADSEESSIVVTGNRAPVMEIQSSPSAVTVIANDSIDRKAGEDDPNAPRIAIDAWQPDRPYLKAFDAAPNAFATRFATEEATHGGVPAFYLDTAEWLRKRGRNAEAAEMVVAALDLPSANTATFGLVAARLERYGAIDRAIELRERIAALEPDRPQPKRLLALALARRAALRPATAKADLERAIALLSEVALTPWDDTWDGIELISLMEANALIPRLEALGGTAKLDPRLIGLLDVDLRVVVDWDTNATDLDLWVDEPTGERAIYNNPRTAIGGRLSNDMTSGYGPEEYMIHRAPAGTYTVRADVYASDRIDPNGASVITVRLIRNFGRPNQSEESVDIELLGNDGGEKLVGTIQVKPR
ncbi:VIT domain-containing protein [Sphingomonas sp. G-3-2-10]|uniref:VIT domain-containing protein n=1 Tax=Sphingomonas sp. G-3-2-10 TaxID=2728838 RepID=UPI00146D55B5|nr:VIT domain-containing protein [Sphingomonas sp. G-3-2-10]NML08299.1 hypothetical protein [Sphingomonas sp. G-3-2-10]